jgi:hypothetical protein
MEKVAPPKKSSTIFLIDSKSLTGIEASPEENPNAVPDDVVRWFGQLPNVK